jgi:DNA-binding YbaB/EbfC family protein
MRTPAESVVPLALVLQGHGEIGQRLPGRDSDFAMPYRSPASGRRPPSVRGIAPSDYCFVRPVDGREGATVGFRAFANRHGERAMKDIMGLMKQAQQMQARMQRMQEELAALEIVGQAGAGLVRVTLDGKGDMRKVEIDPSLAQPGEIEIVEDLVLAAFKDAKGKVEAAMQERMREVAGGLPIPPGMKLF